jgi:uncharacterized phage infection (PIP) family protein YhgE
MTHKRNKWWPHNEETLEFRNKFIIIIIIIIIIFIYTKYNHASLNDGDTF